MKKILILILLFPSILFALDTDTQNWDVFTTVLTEGNNKYSLEIQPRIGSEVHHFEKLILRPSYGYTVAPETTVWIGTGWFPTFLENQSEKRIDEYRIWEQVTHDVKYPDLTLNNRLRLEHRLIEGESNASNRLRYLLRGSVPFEKNDCFSYGVTSYDEIFANIDNNRDRSRIGMDRNRTFVGGYYSQGVARYELGYLADYGNGRDGKEDKLNNVILLAVGLNF